MDRVTSRDGTAIAYERDGRGPALILLGGAIDDGSENAPLVPELAERFTVYNSSLCGCHLRPRAAWRLRSGSVRPPPRFAAG
jgi:hypothetical protein